MIEPECKKLSRAAVVDIAKLLAYPPAPSASLRALMRGRNPPAPPEVA